MTAEDAQQLNEEYCSPSYLQDIYSAIEDAAGNGLVGIVLPEITEGTIEKLADKGFRVLTMHQKSTILW